MNEPASYFHYWGKARKHPGSEGADYHLLPYHCLDVAAVASNWWDKSPHIQNSFMQYSEGLSPKQIKAWTIFFIALHDYGKFDIRFQRKAMEVWTLLQKDLFAGSLTMPSPQSSHAYDHGESGLFWFQEDQAFNAVVTESSEPFSFASLMQQQENSDPSRLAWIKAVCGHHGYVFSKDDLPDEINNQLDPRIPPVIADQDRTARLDWVSELERIFLHPEALSLSDKVPQPSPLLAGFCSISDWLGSRSDGECFSYCAEATNNLQDYFEQKLFVDAPHVLQLAGVISSPRPYSGVEGLLHSEHAPRQLQTLVDELPLAEGLTIVEAPTGSGKTEMALAYAWRLIEKGVADSIVFAMPTQATANAMLLRLEGLAGKLFKDNPNLILAHGNARFNEDFIKLKSAGQTMQQKEEAWAQCNEWLSQGRKRVFLGQIGICTIDQVLVSVLPVRHRFIRGFGVGRSVLIVDEVHAYDAYMYGLLEAVLCAQKKAASACILLSATLNQTLRGKLLKTYNKKESAIGDELPYPLISWVGRVAAKDFILAEKEMPNKHVVQVECLLNDQMLPDTSLCERIISAAEQGAQVAIICNLVDVAQVLARHLQAQTTVPVDIFHARYSLTDRQKKESAVLAHFGSVGKRDNGRILVATQVVEQSLDVDFDWLIIQLCPVDLLFQRLGRLHRHQHHARPTGFERPLCTVLLPTGNDYGLHGYIYANSRVMWRTAQKLQRCNGSQIVFPAAYRDWIESVYCDEPWGDEPEEVEAGFETYQNVILEKQLLARQMLKWSDNCALHDCDEKVRAVTRDGEFNLNVVPYRQTAQGKQLLDGVIFDALHEWQQPEALSLNTVGVPQGWRKYLPEEDEEQKIWLEVFRTENSFKSITTKVDFSYNNIWGMEKLE